jgi:hypothetical protein
VIFWTMETDDSAIIIDLSQTITYFVRNALGKDVSGKRPSIPTMSLVSKIFEKIGLYSPESDN